LTTKQHKTSQAKRLRDNQADAETKVWTHLRDKRLDGLKFRRQQPIGPYIVDFACLDKRLIIEIDGGQHNQESVDLERDKWLTEQGYLILRFWNNDVFQNTNGVLETIREASATLP